MDKKIIIAGGLLLVLLVVLVIYLATGARRQKPTEAPTITIWDSFDSEDSFREIFDQFLAENKDLEIKFVKKDPAKFETESINAFAAGKGPDLWVIPNNWLPKHHDKLTVLGEKKLDPKGKKANDEAFEDLFLDVAYQDNVIDAQVYGIPLFIDSLSLFYNSTLFNERLSDYAKEHAGEDISDVRQLFNNPPKTWEELSEFIKYYGEGAIGLGGAGNVSQASEILTALMLQYGAKMTTDDRTSALFHTSTNIFSDVAYPGNKALSFYTSFASRDDPHFTWADNTNDYQAFVKGNLAMYIGWSRQAQEIKKDTGRPAEVTSLPQFKDSNNPQDVASYQVMTVPKTSKNAERAWGLITYIASPQIQIKYLVKTGLPNTLKEKIKDSSNFIDIQNQYSASWYDPEPKKTGEIFRQAISAALAGQNPQTVLEGAAAQITNLLKALKP